MPLWRLTWNMKIKLFHFSFLPRDYQRITIHFPMSLFFYLCEVSYYLPWWLYRFFLPFLKGDYEWPENFTFNGGVSCSKKEDHFNLHLGAEVMLCGVICLVLSSAAWLMLWSLPTAFLNTAFLSSPNTLIFERLLRPKEKTPWLFVALKTPPCCKLW